MVVAWLRPAAEFRDAEVNRLRALQHQQLIAMCGSEELPLPSILSALGCRATRVIDRTHRGLVNVRVQVSSPDAGSSTTDGFSMAPSGKITPMHNDEYDD